MQKIYFFLVIFFSFLYLKAESVFYLKQKVDREYYTVKFKKISDELKPLFIKIRDEYEEGRFYYNSKNYNLAYKKWKDTLLLIDDLNKLINFYPEFIRISKAFYRQKDKVFDLKENNMNVFFRSAYENMMKYFSELRRSFFKMQNAYLSFNAKVVNRRERFERIKDNMERVESIIYKYGDKVRIIKKSFDLLDKANEILNTLNKNRNIAMDPKELYKVRENIIEFRYKLNDIVKKLRKDISHYDLNYLKEFKRKIENAIIPLNDFKYKFRKELFSREEEEKLAVSIANDYLFSYFFKKESEIFFDNYKKFKEFRKYAYRKETLDKAYSFLKKALEIKDLYFKYAEYKTREKNIRNYFQNLNSPIRFSDYHLKSFIFLSLKSYILDIKKARLNGDFDAYKKYIKLAEAAKDKYENAED